MKNVDTASINTKSGLKTVEYTEDGFIRVENFCFSPGFRSVSFDQDYLWDFTPRQAEIVGWLFDYLEQKYPHAHQSQLISKLQDSRDRGDDDCLRNRPLSTRRLRDFFKMRSGKVHPAFGTLLKTTKGSDSIIYFDFSWKPTA